MFPSLETLQWGGSSTKVGTPQDQGILKTSAAGTRVYPSQLSSAAPPRSYAGSQGVHSSGEAYDARGSNTVADG